jgi:hypothetical protein
LPLELTVEFRDSDLEVLSLVESGYAFIGRGRVPGGFTCKDAAMAAIAAGEVR